MDTNDQPIYQVTLTPQQRARLVSLLLEDNAQIFYLMDQPQTQEQLVNLGLMIQENEAIARLLETDKVKLSRY